MNEDNTTSEEGIEAENNISESPIAVDGGREIVEYEAVEGVIDAEEVEEWVDAFRRGDYHEDAVPGDVEDVIVALTRVDERVEELNAVFGEAVASEYHADPDEFTKHVVDIDYAGLDSDIKEVLGVDRDRSKEIRGYLADIDALTWDIELEPVDES